jgi:hypothetical protein
MIVYRSSLVAFVTFGSLLAALACSGTDATMTDAEASEPFAPLSEVEAAPGDEGEEALGASSQALLDTPNPLSAPLINPVPLLFCVPGVNSSGVMSFNGGADSDTVSGTVNDDTLLGGDCHDTLSGTAGNDVLEGEAGNDTLSGGHGDDVLRGGAGNDTIDGGHHVDELFGGAGADVINGGNGDDYLHGGCGTWGDELDGGFDDDVCEGNCEYDTFTNCEVIICC